MKNYAIAAMLFLSMCAQAQGNYYVKEVEFPAGADSLTKVDMASRLVPTPKQLAWQDLEMTAFLHFGVNTFTDREWGDGTESPQIFNPEGLDALQWVRTLKDAGFKMVILTAKHHDGFCLWPTATTKHSVAWSSWREGRGDVMAALSEACRAEGMKLGVYLSPWDRNAPCYGDSPAYNDMFVAQLTELLTNYGKIDEVWFDGACGEGPNGKKQEYDWARFKETMERLQPEAVLAIMGDDVRWVGNEKGQGRTTEWSATALTPGILPGADASNSALGLYAKAPDLGGRDIVARASKLYWWPSEVDVSIRPGWFWHESEQPKSLRNLAEIYLNSVGRNSVLLLNVPPDRSGRIAAQDSVRLCELGQWINHSFGSAAAPGEMVNCVVLGEDLTKGQRVEKFTVKVLTDGKWREVADGTTIGHKRILMFDPVRADSVKVDVLSSRGDVNLLPVQAHMVVMPEQVIESAVDKLPSDGWTRTDAYGAITIDFGKPTNFSGFTYTPNFERDGGLILKYRVIYSVDGKNWLYLPVTGEFSNIVNNPIEQIVNVGGNARYVQLIPVETTSGITLSNVELGFIR